MEIALRRIRGNPCCRFSERHWRRARRAGQIRRQETDVVSREDRRPHIFAYLQFAGIEEAFIRLGVATLAGALIGVNRELRGKPAGMRTHALVALGSALVVYSALSIARRADGTLDGNVVTRAVQGIVAGVGFLGGGVILKTSDRATVRHLTTAASLWVVACLGIVCGLGQWALGGAAVVLTLLMLVIGGPVEGAIRRKIISRIFPKVSPTPSRHTGEIRAIHDSAPLVPEPHDDD